MLNLALLLTMIATTPKGDLGQFEVRSIQKTAVFAGKLGKRVTERLEVTREGTTYHVVIDGAYHTRVGGRRMPDFRIGDSISINGTKNGDTIRTNWDGIHKG